MSRAKAPFYEDVDCSRGAPMGRGSDEVKDFEGKVHLQRVPFVDDCYDPGGAYWGAPEDVWCAWDNHDHVAYVRAPNRDDAKRQLNEQGPIINFGGDAPRGSLQFFR